MSKRPRRLSPTTPGQPRSMKGSNKRSFCRISIVLIQAMSMPNYCTGANRITGLTWLVQRVLITNGRPSNRPDLTRVIFRSIGKPNKRPAQKAASVAVGRPPSTIAKTRSSRSNSRRRTVNAARASHYARNRHVSVAPSRYGLNSTIRHSNVHVNVLKLRTSKCCMHTVPG